MFSFLGFFKRDILQTYSTHHFWSKQADSRWWWPILYKRPSSDSLGRMWKLHMYWRLNIIYNIVIINIYFLIFSISSVSLTSNWAAVGMSLLARFSASALTLSRWLDGLRRKENEDENFTTWQMKIYEGFGVDWGVPNWPNDLSGIPFLTIFGEPSKIVKCTLQILDLGAIWDTQVWNWG